MEGNRTRLYVGLVRNGKWYNYTEVHPVEGGTLAMLDSGNKYASARFLKLIKGSIKELFTDTGESYTLTSADFEDLKAVDGWKIGYEQIKLVTGEEYPIIPEFFYCPVCSVSSQERYTEVKESWQKLIEDGFIDEIYNDSEKCEYEVHLIEPLDIPQGKSYMGGTFDTIIMRPLTIKDTLMIQRNNLAMSTEANQIFATWDAGIVSIPGLADRDLNILKRTPDTFFTKKYLDPKNFDVIDETAYKNAVGIDASGRKVSCKHCGNEIGGYLDQTNFFISLLPKPYSQKKNLNTTI